MKHRQKIRLTKEIIYPYIKIKIFIIIHAYKLFFLYIFGYNKI